jgi:hypothetical protein
VHEVAGSRRPGTSCVTGYLIVDQIEGAAEIEKERILALTDEDLARRAAARDGDRIDEAGGVCGVVGNRLGADIVQRLGEGRAAGGALVIGRRCRCGDRP